MANYTKEKGQLVQAVSSDPSNPTEGQIWYNTTDAASKVNVYITPAWASGGDLNVGRRGACGNGVRTAALHFGGFNPGFFANGKTESYDGTSWTAENDQNAPSGPRGQSLLQAPQATSVSCGAQPGPTAAKTEEWGGTCWATVNNMNVGIQKGVGLGTRDAGLAVGGQRYDGGSPSFDGFTQEYDGTSWTAATNMPEYRVNGTGSGSQTAALSFGASINTFEYDGTSWSTGHESNPGQQAMGGSGTQTDAVGFGGQPEITTTIFYDGTCWSTGPTMTLARSQAGASGPGSGSSLAVGNGPNVVTTEELDGGFTNQTISSS